jgi:hypothetical protein
MSDAADGAAPSRPAWQPFTFGGVAAFGQARLGRLLLAELLVAILISGSAVCFLRGAWAPVILQAIQKMPETAKITGGRLTGMDATLIAETKFLAIAVTPKPSGQIGQSADVQIQFRPSDFRVGSVFRPDWGWEFDYGPNIALDLGRSNLEPWWGAWHPVLLAGAGVAILAQLFGIWAVLAVFYTVPAKFIAWFADRELSWGGAWRLSSAALFPGALLMGAAIFLYDWQAVDLIGLAFIFVAHMLMGWVYVAGGAWACPRLLPNDLKQNPFVS